MPHRLAGLACLAAVATASGAAAAGRVPIYADRPNAVSFDAREARFVRFLIHATNTGGQACLDELEVYGPAGAENLALASAGAKATASSCIAGYAIHTVGHLNDGQYGNGFSWIAAGVGDEWAQVELPRPAIVSRAVFSRDRNGQYADRVPVDFEVQVSLDGAAWETVKRVRGFAAGPSADPAVPAPPPPPGPGATGGPGLAEGPRGLEVPRRDGLGLANLAPAPGAKAAASSIYADGALPIHQVAHLNDGLAGNEHSWISKGEPSWAEVDLGGVYWVCRVALGNDSAGRYADRAAVSYRILTATTHAAASAAPTWATAYRQSGGLPLLRRREIVFRPVRARYVRVAIDATADTQARLDEVEVYGRKAEIRLAAVKALLTPAPTATAYADLLRYAFLGEEHAWLKTYGRADLDPSLVPYDGRVTEYPRHVGGDCLPLPPLAAAPRLDGRLDDLYWAWASQGAVRVASLDGFGRGPLVTETVRAGVVGGDLYLATQTDRLLSAHLAVISTPGAAEAAVLALAPEGLVLRTYSRDGAGQPQLEATAPVQGGHDAGLTTFEARVPLAAFEGWQDAGLRIGLGMGGIHTPAAGRAVSFIPAPLAVAQDGPCVDGKFPVRFSAPAGAVAITLSGATAGRPAGLTIGPGQTTRLNLAAQAGPIGPELNLSFAAGDGPTYSLHLFRYEPTARALALADALAGRLAARGLDVSAERREMAALRQRQAALLARAPDAAAERALFLDARLAKRRLFLRDPGLAPLAAVLFVKRHPYLPSHIYTDYTDAPFRPGGGICVLRTPTRDGRLAPDAAALTELFRTDTGIPRDPVATAALDRVYFALRPSADGFYHLMAVKPDGSGVRQLTDGPYHDFYPCPLPDGGLAMISTRCAARVFCFRWTASVLFRLNPDGTGIRPLSFASLSEWAPSVMRDGRIIWTRWEYIDKGADFSQTLWSINPDGTDPQAVFGNDVIQPNGYACGREVPGTSEVSCTLVSHFGDINGPIALLDIAKGRFSQKAITSLTPEVPWPGMWPQTECFRDPYPIGRDLFLCSHAPADRFGLYALDRFGNREVLYMDPVYGCMAPTPFRVEAPRPALPDTVRPEMATGTFALMDVYRGIEPAVARGRVKWLRVVEEVRHNLAAGPNFDHTDFMNWYASPDDIVAGPYGWPTYTAKAPLGLVPVSDDGSACFTAPAGKVLYFEALDEDFNELQRMRSVVQLQPGERRTCVGCHESRDTAPPVLLASALAHEASAIQPHEWGSGPFSYEDVVQPVLDRRCASCHDGTAGRPDLRGVLDADRVPASYRSLIAGGYVHFIDCAWKSGCEKREPLTFGTLRSPLWDILRGDEHKGVGLAAAERLRIKTWTDLNCPLWPDYVERSRRPAGRVARADGR